MPDLPGCALVTGGASGLGRAAAELLARRGAGVVVVDVNAEAAGGVADAIIESGGRATSVGADVTSAADVERAVEAAVSAFGTLDYCVNSAGIAIVGHRLHDLPEEAWDRVVDVNLKGVWLSMKYQIRQMLLQGTGAIVNVSSIAGVVGSPNATGAYSATKHGIIGLTKTAALDYARDNIRVNAVCPGLFTTPLWTETKQTNPEVVAKLVGGQPTGRLGDPTEFAEAAVWLCSPQSSYVQGHALLIDGAYTAQ